MKRKWHGFLKEQNQVDFSNRLSLAVQKESSNATQKTSCEGKFILSVDDDNAHPKWVTLFFRGRILHVPFSLYYFQNLTASVKQIAEFFGFSPTTEQVQAIAERDTLQAVRVKAREISDAVGLILFCQGVFGDWKILFTEALNKDAKF